jgi:hypothetical protein
LFNGNIDATGNNTSIILSNWFKHAYKYTKYTHENPNKKCKSWTSLNKIKKPQKSVLMVFLSIKKMRGTLYDGSICENFPFNSKINLFQNDR